MPNKPQPLFGDGLLIAVAILVGSMQLSNPREPVAIVALIVLVVLWAIPHVIAFRNRRWAQTGSADRTDPP